MKTADELKQEATQFAVEAHCRYCERTPGLKCKQDIDHMAAAYLEAMRAYGEHVKEACAAEADALVVLSMNMGAGENARTAATIESRILKLKLP